MNECPTDGLVCVCAANNGQGIPTVVYHYEVTSNGVLNVEITDGVRLGCRSFCDTIRGTLYLGGTRP